jgi:hypothetical protein
MSTKTTFKRIALVTVAALGFGLLSSTAPASAYAASFSTIPSLTVVGTSSGAASGYGFIPVTLTADGTNGNQKLDANETLTATVIAQPTGVDSTTAASDLEFTLMKRTAVSTWANATNSPWTAAHNNAGSFYVQGVAGSETQASMTNPSRDTRLGTYWFAVRAASGKAVDKGTYTVRFRLTDSNGFITQSNISVNFVASAADSGATITLSTTGTFRTGESITMDADRSWTATLSNGVTNGRVQLAQATLASGPSTPALTAATWAASPSAVVDPTTEFQILDNGTQVTGTSVNGDFYSATASDSATAWSAYANGVYGITSTTGSGNAYGITSASVAPLLRVTYGATAKTGTIAALSAAAQTATPVVTFSGAGALTASTPFNLPLSTKTATFTVTGATPGNAYQYSVAWTKVAVADATPADATWTTVYADASGKITAPITNGNPVDGAIATVTFNGFTSTITAQVVNWVKSKATNISVDNGGAYVALKSATVFSATITDAFGAPVSGVLLQPALSATSSNYSAAGLATVLTDASGKASFTLTDAAAVAAGTDVVSWSAVDGTSLTGTASATITYAATAPAPTTLTAYYARQPVTATTPDTSIVTAVPAGGIYADMSTGAKFPVTTNRNTGIANVAVDSADQLVVRIATGVTGAKVVATASAGAYILSSANLQATSRTVYTGTTGYTGRIVIGSNKTGANTVTFTSGTVSTTVAFWVGNVDGDARNVTLAQATAGGPVVVSVTDRYGNGVSGQTVQVATSAGTLGNGQMTTVYTTDLDGKINVVPVGSEATTITATAQNTRQHYDAAGYVSTTAVNADLKAGNATATLSVTPATAAVDAAQAATDAAAEATDAANAATDAANAAAEAADAATAAAQDAADAVAALSTQVSEMVNALKKQITALTNLVIKIQKKVKA